MEFTNFIFSNAFVIMFLPIWVAFLITLNFTVPSFRSKHFTRNLTLISTAICAVYSICLLFITSSTGSFINDEIINWIFIDNSKFFSFGFLLDNLSALFLVIFTVVSFFVQVYSHEYMKNDECFHRYFVYLNMFNFSLSGLIVSPNLIQSYIFLFLTGVCSYLLAGFWFKKKNVSEISKKSFIINIIGDCSILLGIMFLLYFAVYYFPDENFITLNFSDLYNLGQGIVPYVGNIGYYIICLVLISGLMIKTAQFPFYIWYTNENDIPIPAKALISSGGVLSTGVYLTARLTPMFNISAYALKTIMAFGIITTLFCGVLSLFSKDIRKTLSLIFCAQTGLILMGLSILSNSGVLFQITNLAFAFTVLFLLSGLIGALFENNFDLQYMGGLRKEKPLIAFLWLISVLSVSGLFFSGCFSKIQLAGSFLSKGLLAEYFIALFSVFITSTALFRTYFLIFEGKEIPLYEIKIKLPVKISLSFLIIPVVILGFIFNNSFGKVFDIIPQVEISVKGVILFFIINLSGFIFSYILFKTGHLLEIFPKKLNSVFENELYINHIINIFSKYIYTSVCKIFNFIEKFIFGGFSKIIEILVKIGSIIITKLQTGRIQSYILLSLLGIIASTGFIVFYYFKLKGF